jgi:outer membrane cobalamin receptor
MKARNSILIFVFCLAGISTHAQEIRKTDTTSFYDLSLEQLMNVEITVASRKALTLRESPGIVTVITEDEIKNSGAQTLMDILKQVPGFAFGVDVEGAVALGIRGNWAHEGKMLLLIDGQEMNEALYSTIQLGNHYPVDQIKKIEIIRGPGSAIYGGNAEYAVINIITKNDREFTGLSATAYCGQMKETFAQRNISIQAGQHFGDMAVNIGALIGEGNRSDKDYTDYFGQRVNLANKQKINPSFLNLGISYKELSLRAITDAYHTTTIDGYDHLLSDAYSMDFTSYYFEVKYKIHLNKKISIIPQFNFKEQTPWNYTGSSTDEEFPMYNRTAYQPRYNVSCYYDLNEHFNFNAGGEYFVDHANELTPNETFNNGEKSVSYTNTAVFAQTMWMNKIANVTVGARLSNNNQYQSSFVPRLGITKTIKQFHTKLLFSKAYRAPGIENIDRSVNIKPENTTVTEFETGYQFNSVTFFSANLFDITTHDPIVYYYDNGDGYKNYGTSGTRGVEFNFKLKGKSSFADINYSFYTTRGKQTIYDYEVSENPSVSLAFPAHKISCSGSIKITHHLGISGSVSWNSERYAFAGTDSITTMNITQKYNPQFFADIYFNLTHVVDKGFSVSLGCSNLFNENVIYIQPYNSYHNPLPGPSREIRLRIGYELNFSK